MYLNYMLLDMLICIIYVSRVMQIYYKNVNIEKFMKVCHQDDWWVYLEVKPTHK